MPTYTQFTMQTKIDKLERLNNSVNGNPRFKVTFGDWQFAGVTKSDAMFAYGIDERAESVVISYHFTPKGKCIIDDIRKAK